MIIALIKTVYFLQNSYKKIRQNYISKLWVWRLQRCIATKKKKKKKNAIFIQAYNN